MVNTLSFCLLPVTELGQMLKTPKQFLSLYVSVHVFESSDTLSNMIFFFITSGKEQYMK